MTDRYEPHCDCLGGHVSMVPDPNGRWCRAESRTISLAALQNAHIERQEEWCPDQKPDLSFRGNELGGECGEAQNVIKKLERERHGWRGSRDTVEHLAEELADVIHCAILVAITAGIDIERATVEKFNATSEKNGLATRIPTEADHDVDLRADVERLRATIREMIEAYEFCSADEYDRGWSVMSDAVHDARAALSPETDGGQDG